MSETILASCKGNRVSELWKCVSKHVFEEKLEKSEPDYPAAPLTAFIDLYHLFTIARRCRLSGAFCFGSLAAALSLSLIIFNEGSGQVSYQRVRN